MIAKYFRESWKLTKSDIWVFVQATIILIVGSVVTIGMALPTLVTGLEGMYLKAKRGEEVSTKDVFMYRRKFFPLLGTAFLVALDTFLWYFLLFIIGALAFSLLGRFLGPVPFALLMLALILVIPFSLFVIFREGKHLHAMNLVAEGHVKVSRALKESRRTTSHPLTSAFLFFLYLSVMGLVGLRGSGSAIQSRAPSPPRSGAVNIRSIDFHDGAMEIKWNRLPRGDFRSYELSRSSNRKMANSQVVFTSTNASDTIYVDQDLDPRSNRYYYKVVVSDTLGRRLIGKTHRSPPMKWRFPVVQVLALLVLPLIVGAQALAYHHDVELGLKEKRVSTSGVSVEMEPAVKNRSGPQYTCSRCDAVVMHRDKKCWNCGAKFSQSNAPSLPE